MPPETQKEETSSSTERWQRAFSRPALPKPAAGQRDQCVGQHKHKSLNAHAAFSVDRVLRVTDRVSMLQGLPPMVYTDHRDQEGAADIAPRRLRDHEQQKERRSAGETSLVMNMLPKTCMDQYQRQLKVLMGAGQQCPFSPVKEAYPP